MSKSKNILIAPLNWGLGHATRCIPLIKKYIKNGDRVIIASDGQALNFLQKEFPDLTFETLPSYNIKYGKTGWLTKVGLISQLPHIIKTKKKELKATEKFVQKYNLDLIISDNRFGIRSKDVKSVYITHQLRVLSGITTSITTWFHRQIYHQFDEIWVPDYKDSGGLSGKLGHVDFKTPTVKYIGVQSRFLKDELPKKYDILAVLSGPEPQRTIFEKEVIDFLKTSRKKTAIIRGVVDGDETIEKLHNIDIYNYVTSNKLSDLLNASALIISRSGYSSLMDYHVLQKEMLLIPTPGQYEQEYLAELFYQKKWAKVSKQGKLSVLF